MARTSRLKSQSAIYHVLLRGINRQSIFEDEEDYKQFIVFLNEVKQMTRFELFAFCLMGNHVHLLIRENDEPLAKVFKRLGVRYVQWFNRKYQRTGHLFQDRFKSEPIQDDAYFVVVLNYIYNNPVKAGICQIPKHYEWSSLPMLERRDPLIDWFALEQIVSLSEIGYSCDDVAKTTPLEMEQHPRQTYSDQVARELLKSLCGIENVAAFQRSGKQDQRDSLLKLREAGLSIRQLARITGLSKGVVERWGKK